MTHIYIKLHHIQIGSFSVLHDVHTCTLTDAAKTNTACHSAAGVQVSKQGFVIKAVKSRTQTYSKVFEYLGRISQCSSMQDLASKMSKN